MLLNDSNIQLSWRNVLLFIYFVLFFSLWASKYCCLALDVSLRQRLSVAITWFHIELLPDVQCTQKWLTWETKQLFPLPYVRVRILFVFCTVFRTCGTLVFFLCWVHTVIFSHFFPFLHTIFKEKTDLRDCLFCNQNRRKKMALRIRRRKDINLLSDVLITFFLLVCVLLFVCLFVC